VSVKECMRCKTKKPLEEFPPHVLSAVCRECLNENPKLSTAERERMNLWDKLEDFLTVYNRMKNREWSWANNMSCKYVSLHVDMRDGGCIIADRDGKRIGPNRLAWQYSDETPKPPND